ncbi:ATPase, partial [Ruminococcaceae bacterium OttesenSCG-928-D13]|nr:ATPase [Ruminococcaceae bacterium OttesenSCG-928-D13]
MCRIDLTKTYLGIELGSTRIKAVLINESHALLASGGYEWESRLTNGIWTYRLEDVWIGLQASFKELSNEVREKYGKSLDRVGGIGISAMMHGYLAFDKNDTQLAEFQTWRNTTADEAAAILTERFHFNIPLRWSIAHLYQAMLNEEPHVKEIAFLTTLSGYVHYRLTGRKVLGIGDASGMFPIDSAVHNYNKYMLREFEVLSTDSGYPLAMDNILPQVLVAGADAGLLTDEGARLLDPTGILGDGVPLCPPEGDAG